MNKPILFPFTWLPGKQLQAVLRHFQGLSVLAPSERSAAREMAAGHETGQVELVAPFQNDADRLEGLMKDFRSWAETHRGADLSIARILEGGAPFFDESHVARIRAQIRKGGAGDESGAVDPLTRARLFLMMAESYDRQHMDLETDLEKLDALEGSMLAELHEGGTDRNPESRPHLPAADPGGFMTEERVRAWARLYLASGPAYVQRPVFATTSRVVLETVIEAVSETEAPITASIAASGAEAAEAAVEALFTDGTIAEDAGDPADGRPLLSLHYLPGVEPERFFARFLKAEAPAGAAAGSTGGIVFAMVELTR